MDPGRRAMIAGRGSPAPARDITAPRRDQNNRISKPSRPTGSDSRTPNPRSAPMRNNDAFEDEYSRKMMAEEGSFVLKQDKKKADIRIKEGRAQPIDWLLIILRIIDPDRDLLDDDEDEVQHEVVDPEGVFEGLNDAQLAELEEKIGAYLLLETSKKNQDYWRTMEIICKDRRQSLKPVDREGRAVSSVAADIDKLLAPKTYEQLEGLEKSIRGKLGSNDPNIDRDYWNQLLRSLLTWKAKAKLKKVYQSVLDSRLDALRKEQQENAQAVRVKMQQDLEETIGQSKDVSQIGRSQPPFPYSQRFDPEPLLKLHAEDKSSQVLDESVFLQKVEAERRKVLKLGYIPLKQQIAEKGLSVSAKVNSMASTSSAPPGTQRFTANEDYSQATKLLYEKEVARAHLQEDEEIFTGEEVVTTLPPLWADKYRPRKPRYFNRVQMGYEWNKYNQTHYDHDNPPPKVVQGYKFNIFYPDLIDSSKAPTFKIIRENGRKRGESFAPAGEEDTCLIRFIAGPPYEDIAFKIIDKEWDYSAKRDRGYKSSFDKGILQLHFQYKKIYYRK